MVKANRPNLFPGLDHLLARSGSFAWQHRSNGKHLPSSHQPSQGPWAPSWIPTRFWVSFEKNCLLCDMLQHRKRLVLTAGGKRINCPKMGDKRWEEKWGGKREKEYPGKKISELSKSHPVLSSSASESFEEWTTTPFYPHDHWRNPRALSGWERRRAHARAYHVRS